VATDIPQLSVVVPCFNEQGNLRPLEQALRLEIEALQHSYELIFVDDCSVDESWKTLGEMAAKDSRVRALRLAQNSGQSAALWTGLRAARGAVIVTMDADLQNEPQDLPLLLAPLGKFDCACGSRVKTRKEGDSIIRRISSLIANWVRNKLTGETVSDSGCCYRAFRRQCVSNLKFFKGMHRFLPTLFKIEGYSVTEVQVGHTPRHSGHSHYGVFDRLFAATYDLLAVRWMQRRMFRWQIAERINLLEEPGEAGDASAPTGSTGSPATQTPQAKARIGA
jgi:dolichol-phosphate mannosyltransferase